MGFGFSIRHDVALLTEYDENGFLGVQFDAYGEKQSGMPAVEVWHQYGFTSRPLDPELDSGGNLKFGCGVLSYWEGKSESYAWFANDPRVQQKVPPLAKGGSAQYGSDGGFAVFNPNLHTWTVYQPYEFDADGVATKAHLITVGLDGNGTPLVEVVSGEGPGLTILGKTVVIANSGGDCYIELNESGGTLNGNWKVVGDLSDSTGVSLFSHLHATAMGPSGPPIPGAL